MIKDQTERKVGFSRSKNISSDVKDLIRKILEVNVKKRYTIPQILAHPWMCIAPQSESVEESEKEKPSTPTPMETENERNSGSRLSASAGRQAMMDSVPNEEVITAML